MSSYNKCIFMGRMVRKLSDRTSPSGTRVANGTIAVNSKRTGQDLSMFLDFTAFGAQADVLINYVGKGDVVQLEGNLQLEKWESQNGPRQSHKLYVDRVVLIPTSREPQQTTNVTAEVPDLDEEEVPF